MKNTKGELTPIKGIINKELFEIFIEGGLKFACVKDLYFDQDDDIYEKYSKFCNKANIIGFITNDNCDECWTKFITEELVQIEEQKIEIQENIHGCEGSCPICRIGEVSDHKCNRCDTRFCEKCHGILKVGELGWKSVNGVSVCSCKGDKK